MSPQRRFAAITTSTRGDPGQCFIIDEPVTLDELERRYLRWADSLMPGNRRALAERLGVSEWTLSRKINEK